MCEGDEDGSMNDKCVVDDMKSEDVCNKRAEGENVKDMVVKGEGQGGECWRNMMWKETCKRVRGEIMIGHGVES